MSPEHHQPPAEIVARGYEPGGVYNLAILAFILGLILMLVAVSGFMKLLLNRRLASPRLDDASPTHVPLIESSAEPALQPTPTHDTLDYQDLASLHRDENNLFRKLGWSIDTKTDHPIIPLAIAAHLAARQRVTSSIPATTRGAQ